MPRVIKHFGIAVRKKLDEKGWSFRRACIATGVQHSTIGGMASGLVPGKDHIIRWATALKEPINHWLELAGYDPIPVDLICNPCPTPEETMGIVTIALNEENELDTDAKQRLLEGIRAKLEGLMRDKAERKTQ